MVMTMREMITTTMMMASSKISGRLLPAEQYRQLELLNDIRQAR